MAYIGNVSHAKVGFVTQSVVDKGEYYHRDKWQERYGAFNRLFDLLNKLICLIRFLFLLNDCRYKFMI